MNPLEAWFQQLIRAPFHSAAPGAPARAGRGRGITRLGLALLGAWVLSHGSALAQETAPAVDPAAQETASAVDPAPAQANSSPPSDSDGKPAVSAAREARRVRLGNGRETVARPGDFSDVAAWIHYKVRSRQAALPAEARIFYRRGLETRRSGSFDEAVRLVRGAAELDPTFAAPHLTLSSWFLFREPGRALLHYAALVELAKHSFAFQLELVANSLFLIFNALFLGLLAAGLLSVLIRNSELRHPLQEYLARRMSPRSARIWPWVFLSLPYVAGFQIALPTVCYLGMLWPTSKPRERMLFVGLLGTLLAAPWLGGQMGRLAAPLGPGQAPLFGVVTLPSQPYSPELRDQFVVLGARNADEPLLQFGLGWLARQGNDLEAAEGAYRDALRLAPGNDQVMNNLANVLTLQGRTDEALDLYKKAIGIDPSNAEAYFNMAQIHTQRFDYHAATEALAHASALDFEMVKAKQAETAEGHVPIVDQWLSPGDFWRALLLHGPAPGAVALPPAWRDRKEFGGAGFVVALLVVLALGIALGAWQHRAVPIRHCSNCDAVVCRRCAERRREQALCRACAGVESHTRAAEFAKVLLTEHRRTSQRHGRVAQWVLAILIPGYGLLSMRRMFSPTLLLAVSLSLLSAWGASVLPFAYEPRVPLPEAFPVAVAIVAWVLIYAWSVLGYWSERTRQEARSAAAAKAGRLRPPTNRNRYVPQAAA